MKSEIRKAIETEHKKKAFEFERAIGYREGFMDAVKQVDRIKWAWGTMGFALGVLSIVMISLIFG